MAVITLFEKDGTKAGTLTASDALFAATGSRAVIHEALVAQEANSRVHLASVKDRGDVRGGGKKPWKQKGTGRARHGSTRSPIWKGGGVTFGPTLDQNFGKKINKRAKRKALALVLTSKLADERILAVTDFDLPEAKAKLVSTMRKALPGAGKSTLFVTLPSDVSFVRAAANVPRVTTIGAASLNVRDLLSADYVIVSKAAMDKLTETFTR